MALTSTDTKLVSMAQQFSGLPMEDLIAAPLNATAEANAKMALTQTNFILETCFNTIKTYQYYLKDDGNGGTNKVYFKKDGTEAAKTPEQTQAELEKAKKEKETKPQEYETAKEAAENYRYTTAHQPIMINMTLTRGVISEEDGKVKVTPVSTRFDLPILTILPINNLGVESLDIHFEMQVSSSFSEKETVTEDNSKKGSFKGGGSASIGWGPFKASASFKAKNSYSSKDSTSHDTHYEKKNSAKYELDINAGQIPIPDGIKIIIDAFSKSIEPINVTAEDAQNNEEQTEEAPKDAS